MFGLIKTGKSLLLLVVLIPFLTLVSYALHLQIYKSKVDVFDIVQNYIINEKIRLMNNFANHILEEHLNNDNSFIKNSKDSKHFEDELRLIKSSKSEYIYILYRDKKEQFRYLYDATEDENEKAEYNQRFDPQTDIWDKAYKTNKVQIINQSKLDSLWITIAYPIVLDGKTIAVIGADFTNDIYTLVVDTLSPIEKISFYISVFMIIMLILSYILFFMYFKTRKKGFIDPLTKAYNRQYLTIFLETHALKNYHIMMLDLDHFKQINDNFGHDVGDIVLKTTVEVIKDNVREEDVLIRFGGEEFVLLVYKKDIQPSVTLANRIREAIKNKALHVKSNEITMTVSIGINPYPSHAKNIEEAIKIADEQLYIAKSMGRDRVELSDAKQSQTSKRISDVKDAIDNGRIKCAYQPIFNNENLSLVKYEMLIRMEDKNGSIVPPLDFLPYVKHTQVYVNITKFVLDTAVKVLNEEVFDLSINIDLQDILNDDIVNLLKERFSGKKELAQRLTLEILEHEGISDFDLINNRLQVLKDLGFLIAIDDFGSGYANFRYLADLDIDILKIDGSIIKNIDKDESIHSIVNAIVGFSKSLGIQTVAEQVETKEELETVKKLGIDNTQGYYLGKPSFEFI